MESPRSKPSFFAFRLQHTTEQSDICLAFYDMPAVFLVTTPPSRAWGLTGRLADGRA
jgi:hypothetical protein